MKTIQGDLLELADQGEFDVIAHGCNCQNTMGAGIAKAIRARYPEAYEADLRTTKGDAGKLGTVSFAQIRRNGRDLVVVNAYTQLHWRGAGKKVEEGALRSAMQEIRRRFAGRRIGYPKIGAGLGGGDWAVLSAIIDEELEGEDHTLVILGPDAPDPRVRTRGLSNP